MFELGQMTLKRKLRAITMVTSALAVFVACLLFIGFTVYKQRKSHVNDLTSMAEVLGDNCSAALQFDMPEDAQKVLSALRARPSIVAAYLYTEEGELFASYTTQAGHSALALPHGEAGYAFGAGHLDSWRAIRSDGRIVGAILLRDDMRAISSAVRHNLIILALVMMVALVTAFAIGSRLQGVVSGPILALARTAAIVSSQKDYSVRAPSGGSDEVGSLIAAFNSMLSQIEKREQERARLIAAIEQAAEGIAMFDPKGRIEYVNPAWEKMCGNSGNALVGNKIRFAGGRREADNRDEEIWRTLEAGDVWIGRLRTQRQDGTEYETDATVSSVRDAAGHLINYTTVQRDVTHEARLEQELRQAQKMESIGTLAGGIAHDFNNILAPVLGFTELALRQLPPEHPVAAKLEQVKKATLRARDLVRQIMSFARKSTDERQPMALQHVLKEVMRLLRATLPTTLDIRQKVNDECPLVLADATQMHQIIMNLCTNAAQSMGDKGGVMEVALSECFVLEKDAHHIAPDMAAGRYVRLSVSDTGCGIEPEVLSRIFDPYFTTKPKENGTGIGLAVVHGIVKRHGGQVTVYSEQGLGTTFHIYLPLLERDAGAVESSRALELPRGVETVMIVDDEPDIVELEQELLTSLGYQVIAMSSSLEALETFRADPGRIDLLITDQTMPGMTGVDLAAAVLLVRRIPIILCTGFSEIVTAEKATGAGVREFLMKPISSEEMALVVRRLLDNAAFVKRRSLAPPTQVPS
ncbi:MAG: ATP-binding protein [Myxococcota bacterium]|nr:ATP-binding protein [Myxococcota bacterium]